METVQDMPTDPTTPIDDFDDLYEDSPAIDRYREKSPQLSSEKVTIQQSNPKPQSTFFQLPGLGLFASDKNNTDEEPDLETKPSAPYGATSWLPAGESQMAQSSSHTGGESLQEPLRTQLQKADEDAQTHSPSVNGTHQLQGLEPADRPTPKGSRQEQTATENQNEVEGKATSQLEEQRNINEQISTSHSADVTHTSQWAAGVAGAEPREPPVAVAPSGVSDLSKQDSHHQMEEENVAEAGQTSMEEHDLAETADAEPAPPKEDKIGLVGQPSTDIVQTGVTAEQQIHKSAGELPRDVETSVASSPHTNVSQAPAPQVEMKDAAAAGKEQTSEQVAEANIGNGGAEFELDSSLIESSSESDPDSSSSSSGDSDYEMLDPEEEARRLMQEDGGSDDEGKGGKGPSGPLRTLNEKPDEVVPKPQVEITPEMTVSELGSVEHVVENSILIKGKTSGETRALESGSLLCLEDRSVVGVVAELLGQVHQPYYSVRFTNPATITEAGVSKGTSIFYVEQHSRYVFTQNLKALKGSDASNIHDEEVGDDELEFSDDEAEAEHKRRVKQERHTRRGDREERSERGGRGGRTDRGGRNDRGGRGNRGDGFPRAPRGAQSQREGRGHFHQAEAQATSSPTMNYDDNDDGDDLYTPLARPSNLHEIMGRGEAPQESLNNHVNGSPGAQRIPRGGRPERGRGRGDRGRGDRGRGARGGGRGDRGNRGGFNRDSRNSQYDSQEQQYHNQKPPSPGHNQNNYPSFPAPSNGWPNQYQPNQSQSNSFQPNHSAPPNPSYQQPRYIPPQQDHNQYNQPFNPSQYQYPPPQTQPFQNYNNNSQYTPSSYQAPSPTPPTPSNIPAGAHINPAFFAQAWPQQQPYNNNNTMTSQMGEGGDRSPQSAEAFKAAQDRLDLLRQLTRNAGSPS
ncbi:MAG: hypothetical protein Q9168_002430 [Polycauliona sp. 1 TL-2023]